MKPAGIERNREIAEARGERCMHYTALPMEFGGKGPSCTARSICFPDACAPEIEKGEMNEEYCLAYKDKPWSTDIATAFELWEEMKGAGVVIIKTYHEGGRVACNFYPYKSVEIFSYKGEDVADAISGAWWKWKEGA